MEGITIEFKHNGIIRIGFQTTGAPNTIGSLILKNPGTEVTLITRPRRFGKTLGMSMLAEFFDIEKDSRKIFQGLEISNHEKLCHAWQNQRPTVFLTFKNVDGLSFEVIILKVVDFPAPLGPNNPKIYPTSTPNDVPLTA